MTPDEDEDEENEEPEPKKGKERGERDVRRLRRGLPHSTSFSTGQATDVAMRPVLPSTRAVPKSPQRRTTEQIRHDVALRRSTLNVADVRQSQRGVNSSGTYHC